MNIEEIVSGLIEIKLKSDEDFLKIRETLTRIGVSSRKENKLYQSCHILHKRGKYYIVHFKELFKLDGLPSDISDDDIARRAQGFEDQKQGAGREATEQTER